jgi:hypothetical protein
MSKSILLYSCYWSAICKWFVLECTKIRKRIWSECDTITWWCGRTSKRVDWSFNKIISHIRLMRPISILSVRINGCWSLPSTWIFISIWIHIEVSNNWSTIRDSSKFRIGDSYNSSPWIKLNEWVKFIQEIFKLTIL